MEKYVFCSLLLVVFNIYIFFIFWLFSFPCILLFTFINLIPQFFLKLKKLQGPKVSRVTGQIQFWWNMVSLRIKDESSMSCWTKHTAHEWWTSISFPWFSFNTQVWSTLLLKISDFQIKSSFEFRWLGEPKGIVLVFATFKTSLFSLNQSVKVFLQFRRYVRNRFAIKMHSRAICIKMYSTVMT